jgi:lipoprotein-anchoring transpeptidase ErfK/SrfK
MKCQHILSALALPAIVFVTSGCSTSRSAIGVSLEEAAYGTVYLGANGQIVADPRAAKLSKQKKSGKPASRTPATQIAEGYWNGDGIPGASSIQIRLGEQKAYFYKGGKLVGMSPISTGREGYATPSGHFRVIQKNEDHVSNLYGNYVDDAGKVVIANVGVNRDPRPPGTRFQGASMPYFLRIHGAVGLHGGYLPGYPASHGCIRLPMNMAEVFFANVSGGTPVSVTN